MRLLIPCHAKIPDASRRPPEAMACEKYHLRRDFRRNSGTQGDARATDRGGFSFVIRKHTASRLHYHSGWRVLLSWAVPKRLPSIALRSGLADRTRRHCPPAQRRPLTANAAAAASNFGQFVIQIWLNSVRAGTSARSIMPPRTADIAVVKPITKMVHAVSQSLLPPDE